MKRLLLLLLLSACPRPPAPPVEACTGQTPLKPGIPGSPGHLMTSERNPNGDSELAALMRNMERDLALARDSLERNEAVPALLPKHRRIRCSWPTDPSDRNASFDALAQQYLQAVEAFDAHPADRRAAFLGVLDGCTACHQNTCPGPLAAIEALRR